MIQALRIGSTVFVGAPFEITVESGRPRCGRRCWPPPPATASTTPSCRRWPTSTGATAPPPRSTTSSTTRAATPLHGPDHPAVAAPPSRPASPGAVGRAEAVADVAAPRRSGLPSQRYLSPADRRRRHPPGRRGRGLTSTRPRSTTVAGSSGGPTCGLGDLRWHEPLVRVERADGTVAADDQWGRVAVLQGRARRAGGPLVRPPLRSGPAAPVVVLANRRPARGAGRPVRRQPRRPGRRAGPGGPVHWRTGLGEALDRPPAARWPTGCGLALQHGPVRRQRHDRHRARPCPSRCTAGRGLGGDPLGELHGCRRRPAAGRARRCRTGGRRG